MRDDVYKSLNTKTTEELQKIWEENDRNEFSNIAFEVIEEILKKRNVTLKPIDKPSEFNKKKEGSFWSFDEMVTGKWMKLLYILGMLAITLSGIIMFQDSNLIIFGIGIIILGNLVWRISCEGIIIVFKIYERLNQIEKKIK